VVCLMATTCVFKGERMTEKEFWFLFFMEAYEMFTGEDIIRTFSINRITQ
jgi:hypothetical protein